MTKTLKTIAVLLFIIMTSLGQAKICKLTSYAAGEDGNSYGFKGDRLKEGYVAADTRYYPYNTKLKINGEIYIVKDIGSAVKGPNHLDVYCSSIHRMNQRGTTYGDVEVVGAEKPANPIIAIKKPYSHSTHKDLTCDSREIVAYSSKRAANHAKIEDHEILICMD